MTPSSPAASFKLKADALRPLSVKSDVRGARRAAAHLGAIVAVGAALWLCRGTWWAAAPLLLLLAYLEAFLFNPLHETAHQTAFRTRRWNYLLGHFAGFAILLPYEYYRAFHWDHHRYTQDPARDPELSSPLPRNRRALAWYVVGPPVWVGRVTVLLRHVAGRVTEPWVAADKRGLIVREARWVAAGYLAVMAASIAAGSFAAVWLWLLPMTIGQVFMRQYLLSEHTGCADNANMLENTRTVYAGAFVRFFAWNMPFHVEHHAYPSVPFHALPRLNALLGPHILHTAPSYRSAMAAVVRHLDRVNAPAAAGR